VILTTTVSKIQTDPTTNISEAQRQEITTNFEAKVSRENSDPKELDYQVEKRISSASYYHAVPRQVPRLACEKILNRG
jgi:hypothetical protein